MTHEEAVPVFSCLIELYNVVNVVAVVVVVIVVVVVVVVHSSMQN